MMFTSYFSIQPWMNTDLPVGDTMRVSPAGMRTVYHCTLSDVNGKPYIQYMESHHAGSGEYAPDIEDKIQSTRCS